MIRLSHVSVAYPGSERPVINDLTLTIDPGEFLVILGSNGSGKSSLLKTMVGKLKPHKGTLENHAQRPAFLTQNPSDTMAAELTVLDNCVLNELTYQHASFERSTHEEERFYLDYLASFNPRLADKMRLPVERLSGGERQALALALALRHSPDLLFLDEHTSALDPQTAEAIMELNQHHVHQKEITTVMISHNTTHALKYGQRLVGLKGGQICFDKKGEDKKNLKEKDLWELYG